MQALSEPSYPGFTGERRQILPRAIAVMIADCTRRVATALEGPTRREAVVGSIGASRRRTVDARAPAAPRIRQAPVSARRSEVASARNRKWEGRAGGAEVRAAARLAVRVPLPQEVPEHATAHDAFEHAAKHLGNVAIVAEGSVRMVVARVPEAAPDLLDLDTTLGQVLRRAAQSGDLCIRLSDASVDRLDLADDGVIGWRGRPARLRIERGEIVLAVAGCYGLERFLIGGIVTAAH